MSLKWIIKVANYYDIKYNLKFASDVINLSSFRDKKEKDRKKELAEKNFSLLFDAMDIDTLISNNGKATVDLMHEARKKNNFKKLPLDSPPWLVHLINIIDIKDPKIRNAKYTFAVTSGAFGGDRDSVDLNIKLERDLEKLKFIENAKKNKIKFFKFKDWVLDYPMTFHIDVDIQNQHKDEMVDNAKKYLKFKHGINVLKELNDNLITKKDDPQNMPIGTKLYWEGSIEIIKSDNNTWKFNFKDFKNSLNEYFGWSDEQILNMKNNSTNDLGMSWKFSLSTDMNPSILKKPIKYFEDKFSQFEPDPSLIIQLIDDFISKYPEKVLLSASWITDDLLNEYYHLPHFIPYSNVLDDLLDKLK